MDPEACLKHVADLCSEQEWEEARFALRDYDNWISRGGFIPPSANAAYQSLIYNYPALNRID